MHFSAMRDVAVTRRNQTSVVTGTKPPCNTIRRIDTESSVGAFRFRVTTDAWRELEGQFVAI